jgi:hypothetical protein
MAQSIDSLKKSTGFLDNDWRELCTPESVNRRICMRTRVMMPLLGMAFVVAQVSAQGGRSVREREQGTDYERRSDAPRGAKSVVVPSNVAWTNTRITVTRGQWLRFQPSGEIRLSFNGDDTALAAGSKRYRFAEKAQIPSIPVGALIGRVNSGKPFSIGNTTEAFQMPANGTLFLGVNDDHLPDNSGNFVVKVWEP